MCIHIQAEYLPSHALHALYIHCTICSIRIGPPLINLISIVYIYITKQPNEFGLFGPHANMENQLNTLAMKPPKNANAAECTNCYKHTRVLANREREAERKESERVMENENEANQMQIK